MCVCVCVCACVRVCVCVCVCVFCGVFRYMYVSTCKSSTYFPVILWQREMTEHYLLLFCGWVGSETESSHQKERENFFKDRLNQCITTSNFYLHRRTIVLNVCTCWSLVHRVLSHNNLPLEVCLYAFTRLSICVTCKEKP